MKNYKTFRGFTLIEIMVVIMIIGLLSTFAIVAFGGARVKARDAKRKSDLNTIGRFISLSCYLPVAGGGEYDLSDLVAELLVSKPELKQYLKSAPIDPLSGNELKSNYTYIVNDEGDKCVLFGNLENEEEPITLSNLNTPTPGGGKGILAGTITGVNETNIYFQISN